MARGMSGGSASQGSQVGGGGRFPKMSYSIRSSSAASVSPKMPGALKGVAGAKLGKQKFV